MKQHTGWKLMGMLALAALAGSAQGQVFEDNFDGGTAKPEWSNSTVSTSPNGTVFLGRFGSSTIDLTLTGLGAHDSLTLEFRLFIINTMDGSEPFKFSAVGVQTFLETTFSNAAGAQQFYPDNIGGSLHAPQTGAASTGFGVLGYPAINGNDLTGAAYDLSFTFAHVADSVTFRFEAAGLQDIGDESWGLDNVKVSGVPTPGAAGVLGLGALLAGRRRR